MTVSNSRDPAQYKVNLRAAIARGDGRDTALRAYGSREVTSFGTDCEGGTAQAGDQRTSSHR